MAALVKNILRRLWGESFDACPPLVGLGEFRAACHGDWPGDAELIRAWEELHAQTAFATGFQSAAWQQAVVAMLAKPGRLRLVTVHRGAQLAAVLPMSIRDDGLLESLAPGVSDYLDPLIHP